MMKRPHWNRRLAVLAFAALVVVGVGVSLLHTGRTISRATEANPDPQQGTEVQCDVSFVNARDETVELSTTCSKPRPVVTLDELSTSDVMVVGNVATLTLSGSVTCAIADIVADHQADLTASSIFVEYFDENGGFVSTPLTTLIQASQGSFTLSSETATSLRPYPVSATFTATVQVPLRTGDTMVAVKAVNCIGCDGCDSIDIRCAENGSVTDVTNNEGTGPGFNNPIRAYITDPSVTDDDIDTASANWFGQDVGLRLVDGQLQLDRPFMMVTGGAPGGIPNIVNVEDATPSPSVLTYKGNTYELEWGFTAHSPANYHYYAAGTTVNHYYYDVELSHWIILDVAIRQKTGWWSYTNDDSCSLVTWTTDVPQRSGKPGLCVQIMFSNDSAIHEKKDLDILLWNGAKSKHIHVGDFSVVPLKTIIVGVDGLGYASAQSVVTGANATPTFKSVFDNSTNLNNAALSAIPTITWCNWPGIFSGMPPNQTGIQGNSFFAREIVGANPLCSANTTGRLGFDSLQGGGIVAGGLPLLPSLVGRAFGSSGSLYNVIAEAYGYDAGIWTQKMRSISSLQFYSKSGDRVHVVDSHFFLGAPTGHSPAAAAGLDQIGGEDAWPLWQCYSQYSNFMVMGTYFPGPDNVGHDIGGMQNPPAPWQSGNVGDVTNPLPSLAQQVQLVTDSKLQLLVDRIKEDGFFNACLFVLVGDHGQHAFRNSDFEGWFNLPADLANVRAEFSRFFEGGDALGALDKPLWKNEDGKPIDTCESVYSANGGMAHIYLRNRYLAWTDPPTYGDIYRAASLLWREAKGRPDGGRQIYNKLAPGNPPWGSPAGTPATYGALGDPPAIFVKHPGFSNPPDVNDAANSPWNQDFLWVSGVGPAPNYDPTFLPLADFVQAREAALAPGGGPRYPNFNWPEFEKRMGELNDKTLSGSRTGDIVIFSDGDLGYLLVNQDDGLNGWHGGATVSESYVPLMFHMPGEAIVRPAGAADPAFVQNAINGVRTDYQIAAGGFLRDWHLAPILVRIYAAIKPSQLP